MFKVLTLQGDDSADFLNRLTSIDVNRLQSGQSVRGLLLEGTAKIIAVFFCLKRAEGDFLLVSEQADAMFEKFEQMHFGERLQFDRSDLQVQLTRAPSLPLQWQSDTIAAAAVESTSEPKQFTLSYPVPDYFLQVSDGPIVQAIDEAAFQADRIRARVPEFGKEYKSGDLCINVGLLDFIHRAKGCYPGQEVVEKALNIGHPAKALVLLKGQVDVDAELTLEDKPVGTVTSSVDDAALAIVRWKAASKGTTLCSNSDCNLVVM